MAVKFIPHDYQETAINFQMTRPRGLLILDMGLGKTVSSLTAIKQSMFPKDGSEARYKRPLIIAPKIVSENTWASELAKWSHLKRLKYVEIDASRTDLREKQLGMVEDGVITIISESKLAWLMETIEDFDNDFEWTFDCVYIDEITLFKSPKSKRYKLLRKKLQNRCPFVYGLTGTPAPNDLSDLWAIMMLIDKGVRLGRTKKDFNSKFCKGIRIPVAGMQKQYITNYKVAEESYSDIMEALEDVALAMSAEDYLDDNPETEVIKHHLPLPQASLDLIDELTLKRVMQFAETERTTKEARLLRRIERYRQGTIRQQRKIPELEARLDNDDIVLRASHVFSLINISRQLAGGAVYESLDEEATEVTERRLLLDNDVKLQKLDEIIQATKSPVLVFYHFKHEVDRIRKLYPDAKLLNTANAHQMLPQWNKGNVPVLLANPASTKFGLNMQDGGHTIVWFGLDYSFEKYVQSNARLARQGQKNKVTIHVLLSEGTIDTQALEPAILEKSETNQYVYEALKSSLNNTIYTKTGKDVTFG